MIWLRLFEFALAKRAMANLRRSGGRYIGEMSNAQIDRPDTPGCEDCAQRRMGYDEDVCSKSQKTCGHHCNHSWTHDACCWCPARWGEEGIRLDRVPFVRHGDGQNWLVP